MSREKCGRHSCSWSRQSSSAAWCLTEDGLVHYLGVASSSMRDGGEEEWEV